MPILERLFLAGGQDGAGHRRCDGHRPHDRDRPLPAPGRGSSSHRARPKPAESAAAEINAEGHPGTVEGFAGDVSSEAGIAALASEVEARTDRLHILFNNAGVSWGAPLEAFPHAAWQKVMDVNVAGLFTVTQRLLPLLEASSRRDDPARIVNLGSVMGSAMLARNVYSYAASKAAVHHLTRCLAGELAGRHVTVNAFAPGPFQSKMTAFATSTDAQG
jgi:NAD(P)-dependent dehydrogenase (short-subunit alcohol dehydrogenase family)